METGGGGPLSFRPVPREPTPSRDWKSIEWRRSTVAGDRYTSIVPVNLNSGRRAQWIQWNASLLSDSSPFPAFSLCIYIPPRLSPPSPLSKTRSERSPSRDRGQRYRSWLVSTAGSVLDTRRVWCIRTIDRKVGGTGCRDNRFSNPPSGDALTFQVVTNVGLTSGSITSTFAKRVFIDVLRHDDDGPASDFRSRFTRIGLGNVVLIALPINPW